MSTQPKNPGLKASRSEPQSFRARELMASLTVKDLAKSLDWYEDVVGFAVERHHERDGMSLQFTTAQNIDALAARIKARGGTLASEPVDMPWGPRVFRIADPDGFKLVCSS